MKFLQKLIITYILFSFFMPAAHVALHGFGVDSSSANPIVLFSTSSFALLASVLVAHYSIEGKNRAKGSTSSGKEDTESKDAEIGKLEQRIATLESNAKNDNTESEQHLGEPISHRADAV